MEPMIINRKTGEINWKVFWQRVLFYVEICLMTWVSGTILFLVWWFR